VNKNKIKKLLGTWGSIVIGTLLLNSTVQAVTLAWNRNADSTTAGYKLYYGGASLNYTNVIDAGNTTNNTVSGLVQNSLYFFAVTAYNAAGLESDFSAELSYTVAAATNNSPTISAIANQTIARNGVTTAIPFTIGDQETAASALTVSASSTNSALVPNANIVFGGSGASRTVTVTPVANQVGTSLITVTVNDGNGGTASEPFLLTVAYSNAAPTLNLINNLTINEDAGLQTITLTGISSGSPNELDTLTVTAQSGNTGLIPTPTVTYTSPNATGTLQLTSATNTTGTATITVTVNDGQASNNIVTRTFTVTVNAVNDPPSISAPSAISANKETATPLTGVSVSDIDGGAANYKLVLGVGFGRLQISTSVPSGVKPNQVSLNGAGTVQISASLAAINATLANPNGVVYTGNFNFVGADALSIFVSDNAASGARSNTLSTALNVIGNSLDAWRSQYFSYADLSDPTKEATVWGDLADPDQDGMNNLLEFAIGLDPLTPEVGQQAIISSIIDVGGTKYFALSYTRRKSEPLLQYIPEVSTDKVTWSSGPSAIQEIGVLDAGPIFEIVSAQDLTPVTPGNAQFFRLRVVKN